MDRIDINKVQFWSRIQKHQPNKLSEDTRTLECRLGMLLRKALYNNRNDTSLLVLVMEEKTIQSIPVMSFALMYACIQAIIGLIVGIFYALIFGAIFSAISSAIPSGGVDLTGFSVLFGAAAIVIFPIGAFIGGLVIGGVIALIYNFLAPRIGGIKLRFKEEYRPPQQP